MLVPSDDRGLAPTTLRRGSARLVAHYSINFEIALDAGADHRHFIPMNIEIAAQQLEALGNRTRLGIYRTLVRAGSAGLPVGRLQQTMDIALSTLSHHLKRLVATGLVTQERQGTTLICRAHYPAMNALVGYLADECCADAEPLPEVETAGR